MAKIQLAEPACKKYGWVYPFVHFLSGVLFWMASCWVHGDEIRLAKSSGAYAYQLVELALRLGDTENRYQIRSVLLDQDINLERKIRMLEKGEHIDLTMAAVNQERIDRLLAIQVPLQFGFQGLRILLTNTENVAQLGKVKSLDDLKQFQAGFVYGWADAPILEANHLPVQLVSNKEGLYSMLAKNRIDYFPRSTQEIQTNYKEHKDLYPNLLIESEIALLYQLPVYFFVNEKQTELAAVIRSGLSKAQQNGELLSLFLKRYGEEIEQLQLRKRHIIELSNPTLPEDIVLPEPAFGENGTLSLLLSGGQASVLSH